jgi:hypothetical protein
MRGSHSDKNKDGYHPDDKRQQAPLKLQSISTTLHGETSPKKAVFRYVNCLPGKFEYTETIVVTDQASIMFPLKLMVN